MTSSCLKCGKEFSYDSPTKRDYCSANCVRWKDKVAVEFSCVLCKTKFSVRPSRAAKGNVKYCSYKCHQIGEGQKGGRVVGSRRSDAAEKRPGGRKSYPKKNGRHIHRTVAEKKLGRPLLPGEIVHHNDENKQNYSEENLIILPSQAEHARLHIQHLLDTRKPRKINSTTLVCILCEKSFKVPKYRIETAKFCSRLCHNRHNVGWRKS